ncbi:AAA family ATPase [Deinococcus sp. HMF7620]|uniref:AAA family ATPase n=1 Tax=Deinococcus arboris TaxID=2682977 RepID=A0A7C9LNE3_9DEIO|nr:AAA family ATPase [Deinococcus arboris]MVN87096.1 AAA family ATPase [Deinococcus arboris]
MSVRMDAPWQLALLGRPQVTRPDGQKAECPPRLLLILAFVALEGRTARARLASIMWPDVLESVARNNLVHALRRIQALSGAGLLLVGRDIDLAPGVQLDVGPLLHPEPGQDPPTFGPALTLLDGLDFELSADLVAWIEVWRERLTQLAVEQVRRAVTREQEQGDLRRALDWAELWLHTDPVSEDAYRTLMRLHYLNGDRAAALRTYQRCVTAIEREFGSAPSAETHRLAEELGRLAPAPPGDALPSPLPLSVSRPPVLIGREEAWARMEAAWARGQIIFISGEPGVGKSRLLQDFVQAKGSHVWLDGRPGDLTVPYSTLARILRTYLRAAPDVELPGYVQQELSRLLPECAGPGGPPPPIVDEEARLRFYTAIGDAIVLTTQGASVIVQDDWQYCDKATSDFGAAFASRTYPLAEGQTGPPGIVAFRAGELPLPQKTMLQGVVQGGQAIHIELGPLDEADTRRLVHSLGVPELEPRIAAITQLAGGYPQFVQEAVRYLLEAGADDTGPLPLPPLIQEVLMRRLEQLSERALHVARAASVLQQDFTVDLIGEMLGLPLLDVAAAWEELEGRQIMQGERFSHDLLLQAVAAGIPASIRRLLHRSAARTLERHHGSAPRIAGHWASGESLTQASAWFIQAAAAARAAFRLDEAEGFEWQAQQTASAARTAGPATA